MSLAAVAGVLACLVAVGSAGGHNIRPPVTVALSPLIGTATNGVQQVTQGGKIGLHLDVTASGNSIVKNILITVASDKATFSDSSQQECKQGFDARLMVCFVKQLTSGSTFSVDLRYDAPANGTKVVTFPTVAFISNFLPGIVLGKAVKTVLVSSAGGSLLNSYLRGSENVATTDTLPQHSDFVMPTTLLGGAFGVATSVQERTAAPLCEKCPALETVLDIPASLQPDSPFSPTNPFTFTVTLLPAGVPAHYYAKGLYHDGVKIPKCSWSPLGPSTHICLDSFSGDKYNGFVATGQADQNGRLGFG
jgi:hypothetical protein